jgi:hypothetical protein
MAKEIINFSFDGLDDQGSIPGRDSEVISLHHHVQTSSGFQPDSYPTGSGGSFPRGKMAVP